MKSGTKTRIILSVLAFVAGVRVANTSARIPVYASEDNYEYTDVLTDLGKDDTFDAENYPTVDGDYSLQVIQLAESADKELFVYVYRPGGTRANVTASSINISITINDDISYFNYKLKHISSENTLQKYVVEDFTVKDEGVRYYAISSIYRPFDESIDKQASGGNTVTEVNYAVNKQYCFGEINGKPYVNCVDIETIVVTDKFVGFVRYKDGFKLYVGACDSHFVAFNTDKPIDKLLEADVYYTTQSYSKLFAVGVGEKVTFGKKKENYAYLKYTDKVKHNGGGLFAGTYKWDRIQTVDDFIKGEDRENIYHGAVLDVKISSKLTDAALTELKGKKWVLRFAETTYTLSGGNGSSSSQSTVVGDVTILRLKFETNGIVYNLGVIDNKQSGSTEPSNVTNVEIGLNDKTKGLLYILLLVIILALLSPVLPYVVKAVVWVAALPVNLVKGIKKAFGGSKNEKED